MRACAQLRTYEITTRKCAQSFARVARAIPWPAACSSTGREGGEPKAVFDHRSTRKEHAMMFAFVLAALGVAVLGTLNLVAAR